MDSIHSIKFLKEYTDVRNKLLEEYLSSDILKSFEVNDDGKDLINKIKELSVGGKGIRGALSMLSYLAAGGDDKESMYKASLCMEIFHLALLIHDDIVDRDSVRRGKETIHSYYSKKAKEKQVRITPEQYGTALGIYAGDLTLFLSWNILVNSGFSLDRINAAANTLIKYSLRVVEGQVMELNATGNKDITEEEILDILWIKSGEYTSLLPIKFGADLAGLKDEKKLNALKGYSKCLGWAFHIQDDTIGLFGDEEKTGKPVGSDLAEGKNTLFMLHLLKHGTPEQIEFQESILGRGTVTKQEVEKMQKILKESGSYDYVLDMGWKYVEEGKKYIPQITQNNQTAKILESLITYMMQRAQ